MQVEEGEFTDSEIIVMLGENGTGKTTFIRMLAGMTPPDPDSIDEGQDLPKFNVRCVSCMGRGSGLGLRASLGRTMEGGPRGTPSLRAAGESAGRFEATFKHVRIPCSALLSLQPQASSLACQSHRVRPADPVHCVLCLQLQAAEDQPQVRGHGAAAAAQEDPGQLPTPTGARALGTCASFWGGRKQGVRARGSYLHPQVRAPGSAVRALDFASAWTPWRRRSTVTGRVKRLAARGPTTCTVCLRVRLRAPQLPVQLNASDVTKPRVQAS